MSHHNTYTHRQTELVIVPSVCLVVGIIALGLRLVSRRVFRAKLWWDDYLCIIATAISCVPHILLLLSVPKGMGRHINELTPDEITAILKMFLPFQLTWTLAFGFTYLSVLCLYIRVFPNTWLRRWSIYLCVLEVIFVTTCFGTLVFQCTPISFFWDKSNPHGHCINQSQTYVVSSAFLCGAIVILYFLPVPAVWGLQLTPGRKYGLALTFSIGAFVLITSIIRIVYLAKLDYADATWTGAPTQLWSSLEISTGILSACIPSMMPLVMACFGRKRTTRPTIGPSTFFSNKKSSLNKSKKSKSDFSRIDEDGESANNNTTVELSPVALNEHDDKVRLVNGTQKPNEIVITNEIHQKTDQVSRDDSSTEIPNPSKNASSYAWTPRPPKP